MTIEYLDTGSPAEYNQAGASEQSINYGYVMMRKNWESLEVKDPTFFKQMPVTGLCYSENNMPKIMMFGGNGVNTFVF